MFVKNTRSLYRPTQPVIRSCSTDSEIILHGNSSDSGTDYETVQDDGQDGGYILGNIRVIVKAGDITQEDTDCIVNSSNEHLDLSRGGVSRALMKKGGYKLTQEAKKKHDDMLRNRIAMTSAPNLPSKKIIHVVAQESLPDWRRMIDKCLEMAENKGLASIAFPALGTGLSMEPYEIADTMVKAILDLQKNPPANLREVRFVVFQPGMVGDFTKAITKSQGATAKGGLMSSLGAAAGWLKGAVYGKEPEKTKYTGAKKSNRPMRGSDETEDDNCVTFTIYAMGQDIIEKAITKLLAELERIVFTKKFTDTILPKLDQNQRMEMEAIAKQHHLDFRLSGEELEISGISKNVILVQDQIYSIMRDCDKQNQEKSESELLRSIVQWYFIEITAVKQQLTEYTKLVNYRIEKAYKNQDKTFEFQDNDGDTYVIDFAKMEEYPKLSHTDTVNVIRRDLVKEGSFEAPTTWADMKGGNLKVVTLTAADQEYQDISTRFSQTAGGSFTITKIDRIQNKTLWQQYQAKKNLLDSQNKPGHTNEQLLWHGTAPEAMDSINAHGFNRSYCGKNAVAFGDGVYFAVQASYSASPTYSRPDPSGVKRMYYCRVLTGEYTMGKGGMRVPPPKQSATAGSQAMYDSVVNNVQAPSMYIIFNDTQAYPEYLIAFK